MLEQERSVLDEATSPESGIADDHGMPDNQGQAAYGETGQRTDSDPAPSFDWESDDNPYKSRFKGLQGSHQQAREREQYYENLLQQYEQAMLEQQTAQLPPQERQQRVQAYHQQRQYRAREQQLAQREQALEAHARDQTVRELARRYKVKSEYIAHLPDPHSMENQAKLISNLSRQQARQQRSYSQQDRFEGAGGGVREQPPSNMDEAVQAFIRRGNQM